ncbi:MAG: hypothetical protein JXR96_20020 [Deltaproteobacteria bacterium]|nr:hypothetical protein [Deltaproteobacteria bacterium]
MSRPASGRSGRTCALLACLAAGCYAGVNEEAPAGVWIQTSALEASVEAEDLAGWSAWMMLPEHEVYALDSASRSFFIAPTLLCKEAGEEQLEPSRLPLDRALLIGPAGVGTVVLQVLPGPKDIEKSCQLDLEVFACEGAGCRQHTARCPDFVLGDLVSDHVACDFEARERAAIRIQGTRPADARVHIVDIDAEAALLPVPLLDGDTVLDLPIERWLRLELELPDGESEGLGEFLLTRPGEELRIQLGPGSE